MADTDETLAERIRRRKKALDTRSARELALLEANEEAPPPARVPPKPLKPPKKKIGVGEVSFDTEAVVAKLIRDAEAATNPVLKAKLFARAAAVKKNAE